MEKLFYCDACKGLHRVSVVEQMYTICPVSRELVRQLTLTGLAYGHHDGPGTEPYCKSIRRPRRLGD